MKKEYELHENGKNIDTAFADNIDHATEIFGHRWGGAAYEVVDVETNENVAVDLSPEEDPAEIESVSYESGVKYKA